MIRSFICLVMIALCVSVQAKVNAHSVFDEDHSAQMMSIAQSFANAFHYTHQSNLESLLSEKFVSSAVLNKVHRIDVDKQGFLNSIQNAHFDNQAGATRILKQNFELLAENQIKWTSETIQQRKGHGLDEMEGEHLYLVKGDVILDFVLESGELKVSKFFTNYSKTALS